MKRVFVNDEWEEISVHGNVVLCGYYHRYWNPDRTKNASFDMFSALILDVKEKKEKGLRYFFEQLNSEICKDVSICVVPSHVASERNESGISLLAKRLAANGRVDKVDLLQRYSSIDKLAYGGERNINIHMNSICINPNMNIEGDVVLLVDDVTTSGASLEACKKILLDNGAERVAMIALGQSI